VRRSSRRRLLSSWRQSARRRRLAEYPPSTRHDFRLPLAYRPARLHCNEAARARRVCNAPMSRTASHTAEGEASVTISTAIEVMSRILQQCGCQDRSAWQPPPAWGKLLKWDSDHSNNVRQNRNYPAVHLACAPLRIKGSGRSRNTCVRPDLTISPSKSVTSVFRWRS
jgi:hypothetical protein